MEFDDCGGGEGGDNEVVRGITGELGGSVIGEFEEGNLDKGEWGRW